MIQVTPQMRILVAVDPVDFRKGIDGLAQQCRQVLQEDPFQGTLFVFRNRRGSSVRILTYDVAFHKASFAGEVPLVAREERGGRTSSGGSPTPAPPLER